MSDNQKKEKIEKSALDFDLRYALFNFMSTTVKYLLDIIISLECQARSQAM